MPPTKRVFLSDIHLGVGFEREWFKRPTHGPQLLAVLDRVLARADEVKDLVLLGDVFDTWMAPVGNTPPTTAQILAYNPDIVARLRDCVGRLTNVFYLNGNHDQGTTREDLAAFSHGAKSVQWIPAYNAGLLYAEHGNRFAMFNATDRLHDPVDGLPIGYFITRIIASSKSRYDSPAALAGYVDDLLEAAFTSQHLAESVIEALMEEALLEPDTVIRMPAGRRDLRIRDVQTKYGTLYDRWVEKFGQWYALQAIRAEFGSLGYFADRLCRKQGYKVVLLGHTHGAELDQDLLFGRRVYGNTGSFCIDRPTFIEVDKRGDGFDVVLFEVNGPRIIERERRSIG